MARIFQSGLFRHQPQKGLLGQILRVLGVFHVSVAETVDHIRIPVVDLQNLLFAALLYSHIHHLLSQ